MQAMLIPSAKAGAVPVVFNRILPAFELNPGVESTIVPQISFFFPHRVADFFLSNIVVDCYS